MKGVGGECTNAKPSVASVARKKPPTHSAGGFTNQWNEPSYSIVSAATIPSISCGVQT